MITIRYRELKSGVRSYFLDICHNGHRYTEFLKIRTQKGNNPDVRSKNKETFEYVKKIKLEREKELLYGTYGIKTTVSSSMDFFQYYEIFIEGLNIVNTRTDVSTLKKLRDFANKKTLPFSELTETFLIRFKAYLEKKLSGQTPYDYFKKLKRVLKAAEREGYLKKNNAKEIINKKGKEGIEKDTLTSKELIAMAESACTNAEVKRAFLFCACTGLRFCDVSVLRWENIKGGAVDIKQKKTNVPVYINLNEDGRHLLGTRGLPNELIFDLPSHTSCLAILKDWTKKAEIDKHITWHCARHSFGTNLVAYGIDVATVSKLLGHTSYDYTMNYVRVNEEIKEMAVQSLPQMIKNKKQ
jgi:integrase/recombinase XerD